MDESYYKSTMTGRGFTYSYYFSAPGPGKPVLFFSHGFPSSAYLWRKQVAFFQPLGYGLFVPNHLGYGGTDKPTDPKAYIGSGLAQDMIDILDHENIDKVITVGHDWGSRVVSRVVNYYPHRVTACAFFGIGYFSPDSISSNPVALSEKIQKLVGYDVVAYMQFFIQPDAAKVIEKNFDSFFSLLFPETSETWRDHMCVAGGAQAWIEESKTTTLASHMTPEDKEYYRKLLLSGGLAAPLCWYKVTTDTANTEDDAQIPSASYDVNVPVLFAAFTKDYIGLPMFADGTHTQYVKGKLTRKEVAGDHWAVVSHADELNGMLLTWLEELSL